MLAPHPVPITVSEADRLTLQSWAPRPTRRPSRARAGDAEHAGAASSSWTIAARVVYSSATTSALHPRASLAVPYTVNGFRTTIYRAGSYSGAGTNAPATKLLAGGALDPSDADQHGMVPAGRRVSATDAIHPDGTGRLVSFREPNGADDAVFLPFFANNICSAVVPTAANSNVDTFFTAEMSGCSIFIDRVTAVPAPVGVVANPISVGDLVVYHANAMSRSASAATVQANPAATANVPARNHMRNVHYPRAAANYTNNVLPGPGLTLQRVALCERSVYMQVVEGELARKRLMGRTNVLFSGGTNVMGFRVGAGWQFWFQTWGWVTYDRPVSAARVFKGSKKKATGPARIWDVGRLY